MQTRHYDQISTLLAQEKKHDAKVIRPSIDEIVLNACVQVHGRGSGLTTTNGPLAVSVALSLIGPRETFGLEVVQRRPRECSVVASSDQLVRVLLWCGVVWCLGSVMCSWDAGRMFANACSGCACLASSSVLW